MERLTNRSVEGPWRFPDRAALCGSGGRVLRLRVQQPVRYEHPGQSPLGSPSSHGAPTSTPSPKPMQRVGLIIGQLTWGGAERQLYELAIRLPGEGFTPVIYCLSEDDTPYRALLETRQVPARLFPRGRHFDLRRAWDLRRTLDRDGIVLCHAWLVNDDSYTA